MYLLVGYSSGNGIVDSSEARTQDILRWRWVYLTMDIRHLYFSKAVVHRARVDTERSLFPARYCTSTDRCAETDKALGSIGSIRGLLADARRN